MSAVTNMTQNDLLEVVPPFIAQGSSAMVRLLELPPGTPVSLLTGTPALRDDHHGQ
jgi:hypothetical protein